jgi:pimeloyl-ACP methyl ester carboxylesterase
VEPVELPSGHFPMITHPELLADALAQLDSQ